MVYLVQFLAKVANTQTWKLEVLDFREVITAGYHDILESQHTCDIIAVDGRMGPKKKMLKAVVAELSHHDYPLWNRYQCS